MDDTPEAPVESVTKTDLLGLNSWDRERSDDELFGLLDRLESAASSQADEE